MQTRLSGVWDHAQVVCEELSYALMRLFMLQVPQILLQLLDLMDSSSMYLHVGKWSYQLCGKHGITN